MSENLDISRFLSEVLLDWQNTRLDFPDNVYPASHWPIPFFGNPATAIVATVGVNPSSREFYHRRNWHVVQSNSDWKRRLKYYFGQKIAPHEWFGPWQIGLQLLGLSYGSGTAAHFDVSYRPTRAMFKNNRTNPIEFRRMVEQDVAWFFRLLPLCKRLRLLLIFGPVPRANGSAERLCGFLKNSAPDFGFKQLPDGSLQDSATKRTFKIHEADTPGEKCVTCRVVKNLYAHREILLRSIL